MNKIKISLCIDTSSSYFNEDFCQISLLKSIFQFKYFQGSHFIIFFLHNYNEFFFLINFFSTTLKDIYKNSRFLVNSTNYPYLLSVFSNSEEYKQLSSLSSSNLEKDTELRSDSSKEELIPTTLLSSASRKELFLILFKNSYFLSLLIKVIQFKWLQFIK